MFGSGKKWFSIVINVLYWFARGYVVLQRNCIYTVHGLICFYSVDIDSYVSIVFLYTNYIPWRELWPFFLKKKKCEFFLPLNVLSIIMEKWHQRKWILKVYRQKIVRWPTCKTIYLSCFLSFFFFFFCLNSHIFLHCMSWLFTFSPIIIRML